MRFKNWLHLTEFLSGPGGGPDPMPFDLESMAKADARKGVGAFPTLGGDEPPKPARTATAGYEDPRFAGKRKYMSAGFDSPWDTQLETEDGYVYHGTNDSNFYDILSAGYVDVFEPWHGTEQDAWPDGGTEKRSYWTGKADSTKYFIPEGGRPVVIRTRFDPKIFKKEGTGDLYSRKRIPVAQIEVLTGGRWVPASSVGA